MGLIDFYIIEEFNLNTDWHPFLISLSCCFFFQFFSYFVLSDYFIAISLALIHTLLLLSIIKEFNLNRKLTWYTIFFVCSLILVFRLYS